MRTLYLALETTGPDPDRDAILGIGLLDDDGAVLVDTLVHPRRLADWPAAGRCRLTPEDVANAPLLDELVPGLIAAVREARVVVYDAAAQVPFLRGVLTHATEVQCAMRAFATALGQHDARQGAWQRHPIGVAAAHVGHDGADRRHRAIADCHATRAVWQWLQAQPMPGQGIADVA